jgi:phenylpropionate dioxygenase-like ring-hydroxylating dioxygenase large terminal subunit
MYINFWYPIGLSKEVSAEQPFRVQIFGLPFVAFRDDDGEPHVLSDTCVHRGSSLLTCSVTPACIAAVRSGPAG